MHKWLVVDAMCQYLSPLWTVSAGCIQRLLRTRRGVGGVMPLSALPTRRLIRQVCQALLHQSRHSVLPEILPLTVGQYVSDGCLSRVPGDLESALLVIRDAKKGTWSD